MSTVTISRTQATSFVVAVVVILALNVVGAFQLRLLRGIEKEVKMLRSFPAVGQWLPTVTTVSTNGDSVVVGETTPDRAQVLIFFTTTCEFCRATLPVWKSISSTIAAQANNNVDVVWLSGSNMDSTRAYTIEHGITDQVVKFPNAKWANVFKVRGVPITVVIDRWGRVAHMKAGTFDSQLAQDSVVNAALFATKADSVAIAVRDSLAAVANR